MDSKPGANVPASTKIRFTRVGNVDTDRLVRRRAHIVATKSDFCSQRRCSHRAAPAGP